MFLENIYSLIWGGLLGVAFLFFLELQTTLVKRFLYFFFAFFSIWFGAKLFFLFSQVRFFFAYFLNENFWMGGGLVLFGGLLGFYFFLQISGVRKIFNKQIFLTLVLLQAIGRVACLGQGCCYGIRFFNWGRLPTPALESFSVLCIVSFLQRKKISMEEGLPELYLIMYAWARFALEFLRGDPVRGMWGGVSFSQGVALIIFFWGVLYLIRMRPSLHHLLYRG